jgi:hypothetical protein
MKECWCRTDTTDGSYIFDESDNLEAIFKISFVRFLDFLV